MPVRLKFRGALFRCGRCRKSYSNPLGHVCVVRNPRGKVRLKPRASASLARCGKCGKEYANPLGHVCTNRGDFRKRQRRAAAEAKRERARAARAREVAARRARREKENAARRARRQREDAARRTRRAREKPPARRESHDYRNCRDHDCERQACEAYREGVTDGTEKAREG